MNRRTGWIFVAAMCIAAWFGAATRALPIDYTLTASGGDVPFADRSDVVPTMWSLFLNHSLSIATGPSLDVFEADLPADLAEPAVGNPNGQALGQIVRYGQPAGTDRKLWLIYERWAMVPSPQRMYFDAAVPMLAPEYVPPTPLAVYEPIGGVPFAGSHARTVSGPSRIAPIPEPATWGLLSLALLSTRRRRAGA